MDVAHTGSARILALELGLKVREEPRLHALALEGEYGRIVFVDGTRTIVVAGKRIDAGEALAVSGGDLKLLGTDAVRIRKAWTEAMAEASAQEREPASPAAPAPAAPAARDPVGVPAEAAWRVPLKRQWRGILVHHSATESGNMAEFDKYHREVNHWRMVGYDFIICNGNGGPDGLIETTDRWRLQIEGAHAGKGLYEYNEHWVGICLVGDFSDHRPSPKQLASLRRLVNYLQARCGIPEANIRPHRDVRDTECPGNRFPLREVLRDAPRAK